jgi:hypothetical protein
MATKKKGVKPKVKKRRVFPVNKATKKGGARGAKGGKAGASGRSGG